MGRRGLNRSDISPPAIAVAERLLKVSGHSANVKFGTKDALQANGSMDSDLYQGIISAMLAEHLPEPKPLFTAMERMVSKDGLVYFSTAIESAQRDHVGSIHSNGRHPSRCARVRTSG